MLVGVWLRFSAAATNRKRAEFKLPIGVRLGRQGMRIRKNRAMTNPLPPFELSEDIRDLNLKSRLFA